MVFFWSEEIALPEIAKIKKDINNAMDHLPERVFGKNVIFIKTHPSMVDD